LKALRFGLALTGLVNGKINHALEGVHVNNPLIIEVVDEQSKLEPLLPNLKLIVGDNGFSKHTRNPCNLE
jgi:PII-like signaling protein